MPKKLILCAGANRSGSTWQYNIVRLLAEHAYGSSYGAWIAHYNPMHEASVHVVKIHDPRHLGKLSYDAVITCYRDLRDVLVSVRRMGWNRYATSSEMGVFLDNYVRNLRYWQKRAVRTMRYEQMIANPLEEAVLTAAVLKFDLSDAQVGKVCNAVKALQPAQSNPTGKIGDADVETLLHPGHIGGGGVLDQKSRRFIERRYSGWLRAHGYKVEDKKFPEKRGRDISRQKQGKPMSRTGGR